LATLSVNGSITYCDERNKEIEDKSTERDEKQEGETPACKNKLRKKKKKESTISGQKKGRIMKNILYMKRKERQRETFVSRVSNDGGSSRKKRKK